MQFLIEKWSAELFDFPFYFQKEWVDKNKNWCEGICGHVPGTNNALEVTNRISKNENTLRERLPISQFIQESYNYVKRWSSDYTIKIKIYQHVPEITLRLWTNSYKWTKIYEQIKKNLKDASLSFVVPSKSFIEIDDTMKNDINFFDIFKENCFSYYKVTLPNPQTKENILAGNCY